MASSVSRLFLGFSGGALKLRQSKAGFDAKTAAPADCIFDADYSHAVVLGQGQHDCDTCVAGVAPPTTTFTHGLGRKPDMLMAVACPVDPSTGVYLNWSFSKNFPSTPPYNFVTWYNNPNMDGRFCGPHWFFDTDGTNGGSAGWQYTVDATNIYVYCLVCCTNLLANPYKLRVRWTALRLR